MFRVIPFTYIDAYFFPLVTVFFIFSKFIFLLLQSSVFFDIMNVEILIKERRNYECTFETL